MPQSKEDFLRNTSNWMLIFLTQNDLPPPPLGWGIWIIFCVLTLQMLHTNLPDIRNHLALSQIQFEWLSFEAAFQYFLLLKFFDIKNQSISDKWFLDTRKSFSEIKNKVFYEVSFKYFWGIFWYQNTISWYQKMILISKMSNFLYKKINFFWY